MATIKLMKNKTFIFTVFALTVKTLYGSAIGSFFAKIVILKFGGTTFEVALATGAVLLPGMAGKYFLSASLHTFSHQTKTVEFSVCIKNICLDSKSF